MLTIQVYVIMLHGFFPGIAPMLQTLITARDRIAA
jgi:hypothetical protein